MGCFEVQMEQFYDAAVVGSLLTTQRNGCNLIFARYSAGLPADLEGDLGQGSGRLLVGWCSFAGRLPPWQPDF